VRCKALICFVRQLFAYCVWQICGKQTCARVLPHQGDRQLRVPCFGVHWSAHVSTFTAATTPVAPSCCPLASRSKATSVFCGACRMWKSAWPATSRRLTKQRPPQGLPKEPTPRSARAPEVIAIWPAAVIAVSDDAAGLGTLRLP